VGIAPLGDRSLDIAGAVDHAAIARAGSPGHAIMQILDEAGQPEIAGLGEACWRGTPALSRKTRPLAANRCILIGDAAGYVEPFTGEGIGWAMHTAVLASRFIRDTGPACWHGGLAERWKIAYEQSMHYHQRRCYWITRLLRNSTIRRVAVWGLRRAPGMAGPLVRQLDRPFA